MQTGQEHELLALVDREGHEQGLRKKMVDSLDPKELSKVARLEIRARLIVEGFISGMLHASKSITSPGSPTQPHNFNANCVLVYNVCSNFLLYSLYY